MTSIEQARADVQQAIRALMSIADSPVPTLAASAEQRLWSEMLALGRALMALFFDRQAARWQTGRSHAVGEHRYAVVGAETREIGTRFGKVQVRQPFGMRGGALYAARDWCR